MNVAKYVVFCNNCYDCPFFGKKCGKGQCKYATYQKERQIRRECRNFENNGGLELGFELSNPEIIPDNCPLVLKRLQTVYDDLFNMEAGRIPKKYIMQVESKQRHKVPDAKYSGDHGFKHIQRVIAIGEKLLRDFERVGVTNAVLVEKQILLFKIAAFLHDIGLADSSENHAIHGSELAKKYLQRVDIDEEDIDIIYHAIHDHSDGRETRNLVDLTLLLADKLDSTHERILNVVDKVTAVVSKVQSLEFCIETEPNGSEENEAITVTLKLLMPSLDDFYLLFATYPKAVEVPRAAAKYIGAKEFHVAVNNAYVDALR